VFVFVVLHIAALQSAHQKHEHKNIQVVVLLDDVQHAEERKAACASNDTLLHAPHTLVERNLFVACLLDLLILPLALLLHTQFMDKSRYFYAVAAAAVFLVAEVAGVVEVSADAGLTMDEVAVLLHLALDFRSAPDDCLLAAVHACVAVVVELDGLLVGLRRRGRG